MWASIQHPRGSVPTRPPKPYVLPNIRMSRAWGICQLKHAICSNQNCRSHAVRDCCTCQREICAEHSATCMHCIEGWFCIYCRTKHRHKVGGGCMQTARGEIFVAGGATHYQVTVSLHATFDTGSRRVASVLCAPCTGRGLGDFELETICSSHHLALCRRRPSPCTALVSAQDHTCWRPLEWTGRISRGS